MQQAGVAMKKRGRTARRRSGAAASALAYLALALHNDGVGARGAVLDRRNIQQRAAVWPELCLCVGTLANKLGARAHCSRVDLSHCLGSEGLRSER